MELAFCRRFSLRIDTKGVTFTPLVVTVGYYKPHFYSASYLSWNYYHKQWGVATLGESFSGWSPPQDNISVIQLLGFNFQRGGGVSQRFCCRTNGPLRFGDIDGNDKQRDDVLVAKKSSISWIFEHRTNRQADGSIWASLGGCRLKMLRHLKVWDYCHLTE